MIRDVRPQDAARLAEIYTPYVLETIVTFEEQPVSAATMRTRIESITENYPWLVCEGDEAVVGYAYAAAWKERSAFRGACEASIYLAPAACHRGIGTALYRELLSRLHARGERTVIAGIALPNAASIALHEKLGFEKVAHFKQLGVKFSRHIDVGYWQLQLEDRHA